MPCLEKLYLLNNFIMSISTLRKLHLKKLKLICLSNNEIVNI